MVTQTVNGGGGLNSRSKNNSNGHNHNNNHQPGLSNNPLVRLVLGAFAFGWGLFTWFFFLLLALKSGTYFKTQNEKQKNELAIAQDSLWNLFKQPIPGFHHDFFRTRNGFQFHFITNRLEEIRGKDLVIFIHGFPNTCMVWRHLLKEPVLATTNATIVALDLPGYGGSDSLAKYDTQVLDYLTEFIVAMREKYGTNGGDSVGSTFIVGHDWGCVVSMRLATDAPSLADRFILSNGPLMELVKANIERSLTSSRMIFKQFQMSPRANFGCLLKSYQALKPVLWQLLLSNYIFTFQLPSMLVKYLAQGGNSSFLRGAYKSEHSGSREEYKAQETMGANLGPSAMECRTQTKGGTTYSSSVVQRSQSVGEMFWQTTAYYRDGVGFDPWEKSIETYAALFNLDSDLSASDSPSRRRSSSAGSPLFDNQTKGSLRAPITLLWGAEDLALSKAICLDGIGDYLARESEVFLFSRGSHWLQIDKESRKAMAQVINLFANGSAKQTPSYIAKEVQGLDVGASLMTKK